MQRARCSARCLSTNIVVLTTDEYLVVPFTPLLWHSFRSESKPSGAHLVSKLVG